MWSGAAQRSCFPSGSIQSPPRIDLLSAEFIRRGLQHDSYSRSLVQQRIGILGKAEWEKLPGLPAHCVDFARAVGLLGSGVAITEFLIAPVCRQERDCRTVSSLGGLANLMVVLCDRLLDAGADVDSVLPSAELAAGGGEGSPVMLLLRLYFDRLAQVGAPPELNRMIVRVIALMFEAEIETVRQKSELRHRFWLRKSSLPFVLMALPAWCVDTNEGAGRNRQHLKWLYRVGRLFGALDDFADYLEDVRLQQSNLWVRRNQIPEGAAARQVARYAESVLNQWDSLVSRTSIETAPLRQTFLRTLWSWLESSGP